MPLRLGLTSRLKTVYRMASWGQSPMHSPQLLQYGPMDRASMSSLLMAKVGHARMHFWHIVHLSESMETLKGLILPTRACQAPNGQIKPQKSLFFVSTGMRTMAPTPREAKIANC